MSKHTKVRVLNPVGDSAESGVRFCILLRIYIVVYLEKSFRYEKWRIGNYHCKFRQSSSRE